jgi:hypothetical protein
MSDLECWTRYNNKGGKYIVCNGSKGQKKSNIEYMNRKPPVPRQKRKQAPIIQDAIDSYKYDIIPMDLSKGSTQRRVETEDRRQQFLQRDRRNRFLDMTATQDSRERRQTFTRTLSNTNEFMGSSYKAPQEPVNPRYLKRMEKTKKQIAEGNYKNKPAEYRAKRTERNLQIYLDLDAKSKKAKSKKEYDSIRKQMDEGEFMKWEKYNTAKNKKAQEKRKKK